MSLLDCTEALTPITVSRLLDIGFSKYACNAITNKMKLVFRKTVMYGSNMEFSINYFITIQNDEPVILKPEIAYMHKKCGNVWMLNTCIVQEKLSMQVTSIESILLVLEDYWFTELVKSLISRNKIYMVRH